MENRDDLTRFKYGLRMEFDCYTDLRIKGTMSPLPLGGIRSGEKSFPNSDEFKERVLNYLNTTYESIPKKRIARIMGLGLYKGGSVDLWIQGEDTVTRIENDLERIAYEILNRNDPDLRIEDIELKMERREIDWNHREE